MKLLHEELTGVIRQTAFETHKYFGHGFLEKVYVNALANRLRRKGFKVEREKEMSVRDEDGTIVGEYFADLLVEDVVVVEGKALSCLTGDHAAQVLYYLRASSREWES